MRKATVVMSVCLSVRPSVFVRMEQFGFHWMDFHETWYLSTFENLSRKFRFIKIRQEKRVLNMNTYIKLWYLAEFFLEWEICQTKVVQKIETRLLCSVTFYRKSCLLWDSVEKCCRVGQTILDSIIRRMRLACWITMTTHTLRIYNTYSFSTSSLVMRTFLNVKLYVYCLFCYFFHVEDWNWRLLGHSDQ